MLLNILANIVLRETAKAAALAEKRATCKHNVMVETGDPRFAWKCADCGYVYGKDDRDYQNYCRTFPFNDPRD